VHDGANDDTAAGVVHRRAEVGYSAFWNCQIATARNEHGIARRIEPK